VNQNKFHEALPYFLKAYDISTEIKNNVNIISAANGKTLQGTAKERIIELRKEKLPNFKTGKLHCFWTQQLANAILALEEL
jgi:hypothetical protein